MLVETSSVAFRAAVFDLKKAKWLKAAEPGLTNTFLFVSSCSNSVTQSTWNIPTFAAWSKAYLSKLNGDLESGGNGDRLSKDRLESGT